MLHAASANEGQRDADFASLEARRASEAANETSASRNAYCHLARVAPFKMERRRDRGLNLPVHLRLTGQTANHHLQTLRR